MFPAGSYTSPSQGAPFSLKDIVNHTRPAFIAKLRSSDYALSKCLDTWSTAIMLWLVENEPISLKHKVLNLSMDVIEDVDNDYWDTQLGQPDPMGPDTIQWVHVLKNKNKVFQKLDNHIDSEYRLKGIELILQNNRNHMLRVYKRNNILTIVSSEYAWELHRKTLAMYPKLFDVAITKEIETIFKLYGAGDYDNWKRLVQEYVATTGILDVFKKEKINKFMTVMKEEELKDVNASINNYKSHIKTTLKNLDGYYKGLKAKQILKLGIEASQRSSHEDFVELLCTNKMIHSTDIDGTRITVTVTAPLRYYDPEILTTVLNNTRHPLNNDYKHVKNVFLGLLEGKYEIHCETNVVLNLTDNNPSVLRTHSSGRDRERRQTQLVQQPHLARYGCWGSNEAHIIKALSEKDYIQAMFQVLASCQNLNIADGTVFTHFYEELDREYDKPSIYEVETDKFITIREASDKYENDKIARELPSTDDSEVPATTPDGENDEQRLEL